MSKPEEDPDGLICKRCMSFCPAIDAAEKLAHLPEKEVHTIKIIFVSDCPFCTSMLHTHKNSEIN